MDIKEAMEERHTVRKYTPDPIPEEIVQKLAERAQATGSEQDLDIRLVTGQRGALNKLGAIISKNVNNYFVIAGKPQDDLGVRGGYAAADLMLYAQTLGLNTWYIGGMTSKALAQGLDGLQVVTAVAVGYGITQGEPHMLKATPNDVADLEDAPEWFVDGVNAALYAPTAMNKQDFAITRDGSKVTVICADNRWGQQNKGLIMYHFELWAGKENFEWAR